MSDTLPPELPGPDQKPQVWTLPFLYAGYQLGAALLGGTMLGVAASWHNSATSHRHRVKVAHLTVSGLMATTEGKLLAFASVAAVGLALALLVGLTSKQPLRERLRLAPGRLSAVDLVVATMGGLALSGAMGLWLQFLPGYDSGALNKFHVLFAGLSGNDLWIALVIIGIVGPASEELFFRGVLQTRLMARFGTWAGLWATTLVFGISHWDPLHIVFAVCMGLYLGWISVLAQSCRATIFVHAVNNSLSVLSGMARGTPRAEAVTDPLGTVISATIAALFCYGCVRWLRRRDAARRRIEESRAALQRVLDGAMA